MKDYKLKMRTYIELFLQHNQKQLKSILVNNVRMKSHNLCKSIQQIKNKMAFSSSYRNIQAGKIKGLLKQALKKRPISIQSLKKSLYINQSNLDGFVKYMRDDSGDCQASNLQNGQKLNMQMQTELVGLRNIVKNINSKGAPTKEIFLKRRSVKGKQVKRQLKVQRSQLKLEAQTSNQSYSLKNIFNKTKPNWGLDNFKQKMVGMDVRSSKFGNHSVFKGKRNIKNTFSAHIFKYESENETPNSTKFYRKSDKLTTNRRWKTQQDLKSGEKSLSQMTKYCQKKNLKGINYLVIQLQLNIQGSKKMRKTTGPFY